MPSEVTPLQPKAAPRLHAPLTNMKLALRTLIDCEEAEPGSPQIGIFYGFSGYGKSVAAAFCAAHRNGIYVEAKSVWTKRTLLTAIAREQGITRLAKNIADILDQVTEEFSRNPQPLIIDEVDHVVDKNAVEVIRDIYETAPFPMMLIGEESLPAKLKKYERFDNRILVATAAQPASTADAQLLREHYCSRVAIGDDLLTHVVDSCRGVTRRIVVNLAMIQRAAIAEGVGQVDRDWWGKRSLRTGDLVTRRAA